MATLTFKKFTATSFQGINKDNPIVIDFSQYHPSGKRIAKATGDQGMRKTSFLHALLYLVGHNFDFKIENFINLKDKTVAGELEVEKDGKSFKIKATKGKFAVQRLAKDGDEEFWVDQAEPKSLVKQIIGNVGTSPMYLKELKGEDQVKELYKMLNISPEVRKKEEELKAALATATKNRTEANRDYDSLKKNLSQDELYNNWEKSEKEFQEEKDTETVKKNFDQITERYQQFRRAEEKMQGVNSLIEQQEKDVKYLEEQLINSKDKLVKLQVQKTAGETFITDNKEVCEQYTVAYDEFTNISQYVVNKKQWEQVKQKKNEMDQFETAVQKLDVQKDQRREELKGLIKEILPPIDGLEVITDTAIDGKAVGFYINSKTPAQLSESELFDFYFQICESQNYTMVCIENISSFGSSAIETLNKMAKKGVYIYATEMKRLQKELKIEFVQEII